jgi:hypothetical protein
MFLATLIHQNWHVADFLGQDMLDEHKL